METDRAVTQGGQGARTHPEVSRKMSAKRERWEMKEKEVTDGVRSQRDQGCSEKRITEKEKEGWALEQERDPALVFVNWRTVRLCLFVLKDQEIALVFRAWRRAEKVRAVPLGLSEMSLRTKGFVMFLAGASP